MRDAAYIWVMDADGGNQRQVYGPLAERDFFGEERFRARYGGGANAYGKCVSST